MIRKLQRKFVLITMTLVTVVLVVLFAALCISTYTRQTEDSEQALRIALSSYKQPVPSRPPEFSQNGKNPQRPFAENVHIPTFCVEVYADSSFRLVTASAEIDEAQIAGAVEQALASQKESGVLSSLELRFRIESTPVNTRIAFADIRGDIADMRDLLLLSGISLVVALAAFFGISLLLSKIAVRPVEQAWARQQQFVADASHELKTPLTVILANADIVLSHPDTPVAEQAKWVEYIRAEAERMRVLVEDLLFLAKADTAAAPRTYGTVSLSDTVWSCLLPFESVAFEKGLTLESHIVPAVAVLGDERQLQQLCAILLDNACKYTKAGGSLTVRLETIGDRALLTVNNRGGAILTKAEQARLFERFYRVDEARSREDGGYGLGLSIAHSIVETHGGQISVDSTAYSGTTFTVRLPLAKG